MIKDASYAKAPFPFQKVCQDLQSRGVPSGQSIKVLWLPGRLQFKINELRPGQCLGAEIELFHASFFKRREGQFQLPALFLRKPG
jgi:hypothetical protein